MKRTIALILALAFVFALVPASALADPTIEPTNPTVTFTLGFMERKIVGGKLTTTRLSGGATFTREYEGSDPLNTACALLGAKEETVKLPKVKKVVKEIELENNATGWSQTLSTSDIVDGAVKLDLSGITVDATAANRNITATIYLSYMDPKVTIADSDIVSVTYPGKASGITSGDSVPVGSVVTVTLPTGEGVTTETADKQFSRLSLGNGSSVSLSKGQSTATFTMPDEDVSLSIVYEYRVELSTNLGTLLDTKWMEAGEEASIAATEPADEMLDGAGTVVASEGTATYSADTQSVAFTMSDTASGGKVTLTLSTFVQLYKLNMEDCELDPDASPSVNGLHKNGSGSALYVEEGATVNLRAKKAATTYQWRKNGNDLTDADVIGQISRSIAFNMPAFETTFSVTAVDQYMVTQKGIDGGVDEVSYHIPGAAVTATAPAKNAAGYEFAYWRIESTNTEVAAGNLTRNPITFGMPSADVTLTPIYLTSLKLTDADILSYTLPSSEAPAPVRYKTETVDGRAVVSYWVTPGTVVKLKSVVPTDGEGTYTVAGWHSNSTLLGNAGTAANPSFTMIADDVEVGVKWKSYTLTVKRYVDSAIVETFTLRPGQDITLDAQVPTGGTRFNYWTHTGGLKLVVNDVEQDVNQPTTQRITVRMGAANAFVTANYLPYSDLSYLDTGAHIEMASEPVRYYALLEYFNLSSLIVKYYPGQENTNGVIVDNSQLRFRVFDPKTGETATAADGCFTKTGDFALEITFYVNNVKMADTITVLNTANTYIHVYTNRPEYVASYAPYNKLNKSVYYSGEDTGNIEKDGLTVNLISADHVTEGVRYFTARELAASEYELIAFNPLEEKYSTKSPSGAYGETEIPSLDDIKAAVETYGLAGYKRVEQKDGSYKYYMQLGIKCFDETQMDSDGNPKQMRYLPSEADAIWIEVRDTTDTKLELRNFVNATNDVVEEKDVTWPSYSWELNYSELAFARAFDLHVIDGDFDTIKVVNEDTGVAYIKLDKSDDAAGLYTYKLFPRSVGVTKITFSVRGHELIATVTDPTDPNAGDPKPITTMATLEITVKDDIGGIIPMTELAALNKSSATLYVGNKLTLYPANYSPNNANTTVDWSVAFVDDLDPKNASYYVSVDPVTGVVEALKYTDRPIIITAQAANFAGTPSTIVNGKLNGMNMGDVATCEISIVEIPVYSLTMYPASLTMYRKASTTLTTHVYPEAATDQKLNWTSSNSNVVSVDSEGRITANMVGTATITATANSNKNVFKTCTITVKECVLLTEITLDRYSATLGIGDSTQLNVYYSPAKATTQTVTFESSDPSVATVSATGKVIGVSEGTAAINVVADDGSNCKSLCVVSVSNIVASAIVLNKQTLALIEGESEQLTATVFPTNVTSTGLKWTSSNDKVVQVDSDGTINAVGGGNAVVTATAKDASTKYADCVVVVTAKVPVTAMTLNLKSFDLLLNDTTILAATLTPTNATAKVTYTSSNAKVASVDEKGKISGLSTGTAIITAKADTLKTDITVNVVTKMYTVGKVVNCSRRVNVRASNSGTSSVVGFAYLGSEYRVIDKSGNWYKIQYNATTIGYIWYRYLSAGETTAGYTSAGTVGATTTTDPNATPTPVPATSKTITIVNCSTCVNVRSGAGTTFSKLGYAYLDEVFTYTAVANGWYTIEYKGVTGYISSQFVQVNG